MKRTAPLWVASVLFVMLLAACSGKSGMPAPPGDRAALERLSAAFTELGTALPTSPAALAPQDKRRFVEQVFTKAGYDYGATLRVLPAQLDPLDPLQHDLVELLFLPHTGIAPAARRDIYSEDEMMAIASIEAKLKR